MADDTQDRVFAGYTTGVPRTIAERLVALRRMHNLSASDLARKSGVDRSNISRIESGRHEPSSATIEKLAAALDIRPGDLLNSGFMAVPGHPAVDANVFVDLERRPSMQKLLGDLQSPLTTVRGALGLIEVDPTFPDNERMRNLLRIAQQQVTQATDAIARFVATEEAVKLSHHKP